MLQEKLAAKEEKQAKEAKYTFALVDGKQEQVPTLPGMLCFCRLRRCAVAGFCNTATLRAPESSALPCLVLIFAFCN